MILAATALAGVSCSYLDKKPDNLRTMDQIWQTRADAEAFLNQVYSYIWCPLDDFSWLGGSDESSCSIANVPIRRWTEGNWSATEYTWNYWSQCYGAIRTALDFEANIDRVPDNIISPDLRDRYKCESKFLRGWFYWCLLRMYGPFVKIDKPLSVDTDFADFRRAPFDECVEYVCQLLSEASRGLDDKRIIASEYGRPSKAACLAVISKVRLLAASELWNGNPDLADFKNADGTLLAPQQYDPEKWRLAAEAARDVIWLDVHDLYRDPTGDPYLSFRNLFLKWNDEIIFATSKTDWEWGHDKRCTPQPGGYSMMQATQNIVDAFYTRDGLDKDEDENYTETGFATSDDPAEYGMAEDGVNRGYLMGESNMYVNREPRFYASISYNGRPVLAAQTVDDKNYYSSDANKDGRGRAEYYYSGLAGVGRNPTLPDLTGYDILKMVSPSSNPRPGVDRHLYRPYIHIRYAEILLNYIEALNEYEPGNKDIVIYFNELRDRAGIPGITETYPEEIGDKVAMRRRIIRERQVELAFEGDLFWTLCRRKLFEKEENRKIERMNVLADDGGAGFGFQAYYTRIPLTTRYWDKRMYLFPIVQAEIDKGVGLVQNPGW